MSALIASRTGLAAVLRRSQSHRALWLRNSHQAARAGLRKTYLSQMIATAPNADSLQRDGPRGRTMEGSPRRSAPRRHKAEPAPNRRLELGLNTFYPPSTSKTPT